MSRGKDYGAGVSKSDYYGGEELKGLNWWASESLLRTLQASDYNSTLRYFLLRKGRRPQGEVKGGVGGQEGGGGAVLSRGGTQRDATAAGHAMGTARAPQEPILSRLFALPLSEFPSSGRPGDSLPLQRGLHCLSKVQAS
ncbi:Protein of unknown function [Gryllus bimaculatus]|nr:Protein of unknown function [Gryllus bimaculatus]